MKWLLTIIIPCFLFVFQELKPITIKMQKIKQAKFNNIPDLRDGYFKTVVNIYGENIITSGPSEGDYFSIPVDYQSNNDKLVYDSLANIERLDYDCVTAN